MLSLHSKPILRDMSQGSRIAVARQFRGKTQHDVATELGISGKCKRRTMTRYEKGNRNPKEDRTKEIANILNINYNSIKQYDFKDIIDVFYILMWLEELYPEFGFKMNITPDNKVYMAFLEWNNMKKRRNNKSISYEEYINWKLTYDANKDR